MACFIEARKVCQVEFLDALSRLADTQHLYSNQIRKKIKATLVSLATVASFDVQNFPTSLYIIFIFPMISLCMYFFFE